MRGAQERTEIARRQSSDVAVFDPASTHIKIAALDAAIKYARKMQDWQSLRDAVDEQIAEQAAFVAWWEGAVRDGGRPSKNHNGTVTVSVDAAQKETGISAMQVSRWRGYLERDVEAYRRRLFGRTYAAAMGQVHGTQGTGENEWYTPPQYIESARKALGGIELDPASSDKAQSEALKCPWCFGFFLSFQSRRHDATCIIMLAP